MFGYKSIVRQLNTNAPLLNAVVSADSSSRIIDPPSAVTARRKVLSENERKRSAIQSRRADTVQQRFKDAYRERRQLIERHRDAIVSTDLTKLSSIIELVEFTQSTTADLLNSVIKALETDTKGLLLLNDRQIGVLVSAGGKIADQVPVSTRRDYFNALWKKIQESNVPVGVLTYNARIGVKIDNKMEQNVLEVLKEFETAGIEPNEQTFGLLAKIYALKGQTNGITQIIDLLKEQNIPATQSLFESLVYSMAFSGETERVKTVIQSLAANPIVNVVGLYISAGMAIAHSTNNVDKVLDMFFGMPRSVSLKKSENLPAMIEIMLTLIENGQTDVVSKFKPLLFLDQKQTLPSGFNTSSIVRSIFKFFKQNKEAGAIELSSLLNGEAKYNVRRFFEDSLYQSVSDSGKASKLAELFKNNGVMNQPSARLVDFAYAQKLAIYPVYEKFLQSSEFGELESRKHLMIPKIVYLVKKIRHLKKAKESCDSLYSELLSLYNPALFPREVLKLVDVLLAEEAEDEKHFAKFVTTNKQFSYNIATAVVNEIMWADRLEKLESLMNGPLTNEKVYLSRIMPCIMKFLKQSNLSEAQLRTISKVISAGFTEDGQGESLNGSFGFRIEKEIFCSNLITDQRLSSLVRILSEEPNVSISPEEVKKIESELRSGNAAFRADLVKQLQRKSKTVVRWLNSSTEKLESEAQFLETDEANAKPSVKARLYDILLKKYSEDKNGQNGRKMMELIKKFESLDFGTENHFNYHPQRFMTTALRRSLQDKDFETVEELWKMRKDHSDELKLLYTLSLLDQSQPEKAKTILAEIKKTPDDQTLIRTMQNKVNTAETLENFINLISKQFPITNLTRKRLTNVVKKMELRHAIDCGDLEGAFNVAEAMTKATGFAFGQNDLMAACVKNEEPEMLKKVFAMVAGHHDKVTAIIDMMIAFLECGKNSKAEQLYRRSMQANFYISSHKLEYLTGREVDLQRPDVLHNLFLLVNDPDQVSTADLMVLLEKTIHMYKSANNLEGLKKLAEDVNKVKFTLDRKLKAQLDGAITTVTSHSISEAKQQQSRLDSTRHSLTSSSSAESKDLLSEKPAEIAS